MSSGRFRPVSLIRCSSWLWPVVICLINFKLRWPKSRGYGDIYPDRLPCLLCLTVPHTWPHPFRAAHGLTRTAAPVFSGYAIIARTMALTVRQVASLSLWPSLVGLMGARRRIVNTCQASKVELDLSPPAVHCSWFPPVRRRQAFALNGRTFRVADPGLKAETKKKETAWVAGWI